MSSHSMESCTGCFPIHQLMSANLLSNIEIPVDILDMLALSIDVNLQDESGTTCLNIAIYKRHFNAVQWMVQHGADCNIPSLISTGSDKVAGVITEKRTPIAALASLESVPLDLYHILKTEQNLNDKDLGKLPLHIAAMKGHLQCVQLLIKLGARVEVEDEFRRLAIAHYFEATSNLYSCQNQFQENLFVSLIPPGNMDIFKTICNMLGESSSFHPYNIVAKMLQELLQRLILTKPLYVNIAMMDDTDIGFRISEDGVRWIIPKVSSFKVTYLAGLLLLLFGVDVVSVPDAILPKLHPYLRTREADINYAQHIDLIWNMFPAVSSLLNFCIWNVRKYMTNKDTDSFMKFQVPPSLRRTLMYHDVADIKCVKHGRYGLCANTFPTISDFICTV